jgi:hypothetical protein
MARGTVRPGTRSGHRATYRHGRHEPQPRPRHRRARSTRPALHNARQRLARYRHALDGGAGPAAVTGWITEAVEQERTVASDLQAATAAAPPQLSVDDVLATVAELGNLTGVLSTPEPSDRAQLYEALGVTATYDADTRNAVLQVALPRGAKNVSEGGLAA